MTIILILVLAVTGFVWFSYFRSKPSLENSIISLGDKTDFRSDLVQLRRIRNLKLDTTIFEDKFFQILQSSVQPPVSPAGVGEVVGRTNPFTPF